MRVELRIMPSGHIHRWGPSWWADGPLGRRLLRTSSCGRTITVIRLTEDFPSGGKRCPRCEKVAL